MSKSTLYGIEKMKAKVDQSLELHLLHCRYNLLMTMSVYYVRRSRCSNKRVPTKERSEVENMKQILEQLIVQRMCMNWFTNVVRINKHSTAITGILTIFYQSGRAETMLESPDGFNLDAFTQYYLPDL